jgi:hypothetical protein
MKYKTMADERSDGFDPSVMCFPLEDNRLAPLSSPQME